MTDTLTDPVSSDPLSSDPRRKRLLYRAMHRGFKEADIVIGRFAQDNLAAMSEAQLDAFERLLEEPDQEIYGWIIGREETPAEHRGEVMEMLKAYPVARAVRRDALGG